MVSSFLVSFQIMLLLALGDKQFVVTPLFYSRILHMIHLEWLQQLQLSQDLQLTILIVWT